MNSFPHLPYSLTKRENMDSRDAKDFRDFQTSVQSFIKELQRFRDKYPKFHVLYKHYNELIRETEQLQQLTELPKDFKTLLRVTYRHKNASLSGNAFRQQYETVPLIATDEPEEPGTRAPVIRGNTVQRQIEQILYDLSRQKSEIQQKTAEIDRVRYLHNEFCSNCKRVLGVTDSKASCTFCGVVSESSNLELGVLQGTRNAHVNEKDMPKNLYRPEKQMEDAVLSLNKTSEPMNVNESTLESALELSRLAPNNNPSRMGTSQLKKFGSSLQDREMSACSEYIKNWLENVQRRRITADETELLLTLLKHFQKSLASVDMSEDDPEEEPFSLQNNYTRNLRFAKSQKTRKKLDDIQQTAGLALTAMQKQQALSLNSANSNNSSSGSNHNNSNHNNSNNNNSNHNNSNNPNNNNNNNNSNSSSSNSLDTVPTTNRQIAALVRKTKSTVRKKNPFTDFVYNYNMLTWMICERLHLHGIQKYVKQTHTRKNRKQQQLCFDIIFRSNIEERREESNQIEKNKRDKAFRRQQQLQFALQKTKYTPRQQKALLMDKWMDEDREEQVQFLASHRTTSLYKCVLCKKEALYASRGYIDCPHCARGTVIKVTSVQPVIYTGPC